MAPRTRARVSESDFCFKIYCLCCGYEEDKEAEKKAQHRQKKKIMLLHFHLKNPL